MRLNVTFISRSPIINRWRIDRCPARYHRGQRDVNGSAQWLKKVREVEVKF